MANLLDVELRWRIFSGRARSSHVSRGRSYLVGEHRPKIFTPSQSGYVNSRVLQGGGSAAPVFNQSSIKLLCPRRAPNAINKPPEQFLSG